MTTAIDTLGEEHAQSATMLVGPGKPSSLPTWMKSIVDHAQGEH